MKTTLVIETEAIVGASLDEACADTIALVAKLGTCIKLNFNDTSVVAHPDDTSATLAKRWHWLRRVEEVKRRAQR